MQEDAAGQDVAFFAHARTPTLLVVLALTALAPAVAAHPEQPTPPGLSSSSPVERDLAPTPAEPADHGAFESLDADIEWEREPPPARELRQLVPGTDMSLCMAAEPTIAVDPNDPRIVAVSQFTTIQVSFDGGSTFPPGGQVTAPSVGAMGDPSLAFDAQGRLFITYLCQPGAGRDVCMTGYSINTGSSTVSTLPGSWPVNISALSGVGGANADKEWLAADSKPGSPFQDRLQVAWIRLDTNPWSVWSSWSSDQGATWNAAQQLSAGDEGRPWPCHVAVGPAGEVYVAWHAQGGFLDPSGGDVPDGVSGQIVMRRSDDGGTMWQPRSFPYGLGQADMTYNVQHEANGVIPGFDAWTQGSLQPWILPDPLVAGRVHVVQADDPDNDPDSGDPANVYIVTSTDSGASWGARRRVDQGPVGSLQVFPTAAIDPVTGAIAAAWFDDRAMSDADFDGFFELDLLATVSTDGGFTWSPEVDVNDGTFNVAASATQCRFCGSDGVTNQPCGTMACPGPGTRRMGEYFGIAYGECTLHFAWPDDATCNGTLDTFYDRDPQLGGDVTPPLIQCPMDVVVGCGDPTDPAATGMATATDACDLDPAVGSSDMTLPGNCPPGPVIEVIRRTWTATDAAGNTASCQQQITIMDMGPPDLVVPPPLVLECNGPGGVAASDPQVVAWLASASATDDCSVPVVTNDAPALFPFGCPPGGTVTPVTFTATDDCGQETSLISTIAVVDTTPPEAACEVAITELWPPAHQLVDVGFSVMASDSCDPDAPQVTLEVTSDESAADELGAGGPLHCPDAIVTPDGHVLLRAERSGAGDGRVYRIVATVTDSCGNASQCDATVSVPHDPGISAVDSGQSHDATACD